MVYWKEGFYPEQSEENDRYEVTEKYRDELIAAQNGEWTIGTDNTGKPVLVPQPPPQEIDVKQHRLNELMAWFRDYDVAVIKSIRRSTDISELHAQANANAGEINELRDWIQGYYDGQI